MFSDVHDRVYILKLYTYSPFLLLVQELVIILGGEQSRESQL